MFREDKMTTAIYLSAFITAVIDVLAIIAFGVLGILILCGAILASQKMIIAAICVAAINVIEIILVPIFLYFRKG